MKEKFLSFAFIAAMSLVGFTFTSCSDDDDDPYDLESVITFENVVSMKEFVQSGTFGEILPGASTTIQFNAGTGQHLMFAMMYANSYDIFFAPENPGIELFNVQGEPLTGDISSLIYMWDNGTRVNVQPSADLPRPGTVEDGTIKKIETTDAQGNVYRPASDLVKLSLTFEPTTSLFTLTITNNSSSIGETFETPLSPGVWAVSNVLDGELVKSDAFFTAEAKSSAQLTTLAETGDNSQLASLNAGMTGIITTLSPMLVVVYSGDINPIYQLNQRDGNIGLKELAQTGDASKLKASLEGMSNVRYVYTAGSSALLPGEKAETQFRAWENDRIAYVTMFGYSNDWFYANSESIMANFKGDLTSRTVLLDNGTGVNQYPGAGNNQSLFDGIPQTESNVITTVTNRPFGIPDVANVIKVTIR